MEHISAYEAARRLETSLKTILAGIDIAAVDDETRKLVAVLKTRATEARLDVRDYELADSRADQRRQAGNGRERLQGLRSLMVTASGATIFSGVQVAQVSAQVDALIDQLV